MGSYRAPTQTTYGNFDAKKFLSMTQNSSDRSSPNSAIRHEKSKGTVTGYEIEEEIFRMKNVR